MRAVQGAGALPTGVYYGVHEQGVVYPLSLTYLKHGDTSKTRRTRLSRRERTKAYVTKGKRKCNAVLRRIYVFRLCRANEFRVKRGDASSSRRRSIADRSVLKRT